MILNILESFSSQNMKQLSTVAKGDFFEEQVFNLLKELLENGKLGLDAKFSRIFWKKPYYSEARKKDIVFDIAIETYIADSEKYSWLTIVECKNYNHSVPVDDIEEFDSKLSQIGEHNTKGFIFSKVGFQSGAFDFACSKRIGLAKILSKDKIDWVNYRKDRNNERYNEGQARFYLSTNSNDEKFFSYVNSKSFESLPDLLIYLGIIEKYIPNQRDIFIPYKTSEDLEQIIHSLSIESFYEIGKLNHNKLCDFLSENYNVSFVFDESLGVTNEKTILGKITFSPLVIFITKELRLNMYRWRFTLAHEIGHLILHRQILNEYIDDNLDTEKSIYLDSGTPENLNKRMEIQANTFASLLLLPKKELLEETAKYFIEEGIKQNYLFLDHQKVNLMLVNNLLFRLKQKFEVSKEAAKYRLDSLGLIRGKSLTAIKDVLS